MFLMLNIFNVLMFNVFNEYHHCVATDLIVCLNFDYPWDVSVVRSEALFLSSSTDSRNL